RVLTAGGALPAGSAEAPPARVSHSCMMRRWSAAIRFSEASGMNQLLEAATRSISSPWSTGFMPATSRNSTAVLRCGARRRVQARERRAVLGDHVIEADVAFDAAAWIEDIDEQMVLGMERDAAQVRADVVTLALVDVAGRAVVFEDCVAHSSIAAALRHGHQA